MNFFYGHAITFLYVCTVSCIVFVALSIEFDMWSKNMMANGKRRKKQHEIELNEGHKVP